jgi:drug/metabolite transporter (DMT)-like permease
MSKPATPGGAARMAPDGLGAGIGAALFAVLVWGGQLPIAKGIFPATDGYSISVVRYGVAFLCFVPLLAWIEGMASFLVRGRELKLVTVAGIAMGASALFMITGLARTRPEIAVLILGLQPAMTALADWGILKRRPAAFTLACLSLAFSGVAIAVTRGGAAFTAPSVAGGDSEVLGNLLVFCAALAWVAYVLITSRLHGWSTIRVSALTSGASAALVVAVWGIAWLVGATYAHADLLPSATWRLAYVSVVGVVISMFLWNFGAKKIGAVNAMLMLNLMPVVTFAFRAAEGASFEVSEIVGAAMVVGALVANNLYLRYRG